MQSFAFPPEMTDVYIGEISFLTSESKLSELLIWSYFSPNKCKMGEKFRKASQICATFVWNTTRIKCLRKSRIEFITELIGRLIILLRFLTNSSFVNASKQTLQSVWVRTAVPKQQKHTKCSKLCRKATVEHSEPLWTVRREQGRFKAVTC